MWQVFSADKKRTQPLWNQVSSQVCVWGKHRPGRASLVSSHPHPLRLLINLWASLIFPCRRMLMRAQPDKAKQAPRVRKQDLFTCPPDNPATPPGDFFQVFRVPGGSRRPSNFSIKDVCLPKTQVLLACGAARASLRQPQPQPTGGTSGNVLPSDLTKFLVLGVWGAQVEWRQPWAPQTPRNSQQGRTFLFSLDVANSFTGPKLKRMRGVEGRGDGMAKSNGFV